MIACLIGMLVAAAANAAPRLLPLEGPWRFALDRQDQGVTEQWFNRELPDTIQLPGSLQEQGFGDDVSVATPWTGGTGDRSWYTQPRYAPYRQPGNVKVSFWLQPEKYYVGAAWYQRSVTIPKSWQDKRVVLSLERPHWGTAVWLDDREIGRQNALGVPHQYDLGAVAPGQHRLTIRVDNRVLVPVGRDAHSVTDHTQGNWNGLAGNLALEATEPVWIDAVQVYPDVAARRIRVRVTLGNQHDQTGTGRLQVTAQSYNGAKSRRPLPLDVPVTWSKGESTFEFPYALGPDAPLWDEFTPALYHLNLSLYGSPAASGVAPLDSRTITFGLREVSVAGKQITVNGRKIFLRGTLECCIFPQHGYPPTDVPSWKRLLTVARAHGLNHLRFHSWCPPEAAFVAADEMGFYYQVECSAWSGRFGAGTELDPWIYEESERMVRRLGNHPSFLLMVPSNEPGGPGSEKFLGQFVDHWKAADARRLYTAGSGWPRLTNNQYHVTANARGYPTQANLGDTANDYREFLARQQVPIVSHEIGQYCVFPNLDEIAKYSGPLKAKNFEIVRDFMRQAGLLDQAKDFLRASGRHQALFYKDEIEACLRTPGWAGFQLLDLHDFPGQGTALVGVLDPFWEEKGYIKPAEYRRFCAETVPLARFLKRVWVNSETLAVPVEAAHFGPVDLKAARGRWRIREASGRTVAEGPLGPVDLPSGGVSPLGWVNFPLRGLAQAAALNLEVSIAGTTALNDWNFWVYPAAVSTTAPAGITVAHTLAEALPALQPGGRVLLLLDPARVSGNTYGSFNPVFWNRLWFPSQKVHTLGLLCNPQHPALAGFPSAFHADWQWQDLMNRSKPMILDSLPKSFRPVVQVIDDWNTCRKLGLVFEANMGGGRLVVCSIDLEQKLEERPAARQLRRSLLDYLAGDRCAPKTTLQAGELQILEAPAGGAEARAPKSTPPPP